MRSSAEVRARLEEIRGWVKGNIVHIQGGTPVLIEPYVLLDKLDNLKQVLGGGGGGNE